MPQVLPAVIGAAVGEVAGGGLFGALVGVFASAVTAEALREVNDGGFAAEQRGNQVVLRSAVEAQRIIYGERVVSGPLVYSRVSRDVAKANENHVIPASGPFTVTVQYAAEYVSALAVTAAEYAIQDDTLVTVGVDLTAAAGAPGPNEYSVAAGVFTFHSSRAGQGLKIIYRHGGSEKLNSWLHLVIPLAYHQVEEIGDVYFGADVITSAMLDAEGLVVSGKYAQYARVRKHLGAPGQTADPYLVSVSNGQWTSAHRGQGVAYIIVSLFRKPDLYINGVPNIRAKVKGALLYDTRTAVTAYSNNWALVVYDYLRRAEGLGCAASEINETLFNAAANVSDENVALDAVPTYQKRYTADGVVNLDGRPLDVLKDLLGAGAGAAAYSVNTWDLYAGAYVAPTRTLTVADLRDDISGAPDLPRRDLFNAVRGTFVDPNGDWQPTSFAPVRNALYVTEDGGEEIYRDIELPFVTNAVRAQRLAKIALERARQSATLAWPGKRTCFRINTWETVNVQVPQLGYTPKVFRNNAWQWQPGGGVDLSLQEESAAAYDWNFGNATTYDPAPNTVLPAGGPVAAPGAPAITEELYETRDGRGVAARAIMQWVRSVDAYADHYQPEYKLATAAQWTRLPTTVDLRANADDVAPGAYDFRVCTVDSLGRRSNFSQTRATITGLGAAPAAPTGLSLQAGGGTARIKLNAHPELDVRRGGRILVRFCHEGVSPTWESAFSIGDPRGWPGDATQIDVPLKPGTYLLKAEDSTGHESEAWAQIETKQASVLAFTTLSSVQEDPTFPGTHSGTAEVSSVLTLGGVGMFDDIPDLDAVSSLDGYGGVGTSGTYTFSVGTDLLTVQRVRITSQLQGAVNNLLDQIDDRSGNVDDWVDWDGASFGGSSADAWVEARETDDDPAGAPTWKAWKRLDAAEFQARALQYRAQLTTADVAYRPEISALRVKIEQVV